MTTYRRCVLTGACLIASYGLLAWAMGLMNRPSNPALYTGLAIVLMLVAMLPLVMRQIWRVRDGQGR